MGALTRAAIEAVMIRRCGGKMIAAGLDGKTQDGTNADLNDPIRTAVSAMHIITVDPINVADVDVAQVTGYAISKLLDLAQLGVLYAVLGNWTDFDQQTGQDVQRANQFADQVRQEITLLEQRLLKPYGPLVGGSHVAQITPGQFVPNDPFAWPKGKSLDWNWPYPDPGN